MKSIYYLSNANRNLYPNNSSAQFSTLIQQQYLDLLPDGEIEAAVTLVSFDNIRESDSNEKRDERLALRSNLTNNVFLSNTLDNIVAWFSIGKRLSNKKILTFEIENPSFFPTTKELLSKASFELINLNNNSKPDFKNILSNTLVKVNVRQSLKRMKNPFYIHLDSSCSESKSYFPNNSPTNFTIQLPHRLEFNRDWIIALKNISLQNNFYNVFDCFIIIGGQKFKLENGIYETAISVCVKLNSMLSGILKIRGTPLKAGGAKGKCYITNIQDYFGHFIISKNLSNILGFGNKEQTIKLGMGQYIVSNHSMSVDANLPKQLAITCDIIENSLFAGKMKQILRLITLDGSSDDSLFHFNFTSNEYLKLENKSFDRININITDISGNPVYISENLSTRLQILFLNINSS